MRSSRPYLVAVVLAVSLILNPIGPAHAATGDSAIGVGAAGTATFDVNATSGPSGESATGHANFQLAIGSIFSTVTALCVSGNQAVVAAVVDAGSTAASPGTGLYLHVQDNGQLPTGTDLIRLELVGFPPPGCTPFNLISPSAVTSGDIAVVDTAPTTFNFSGFFSPVSNTGLNKIDAGDIVPIKFSLNGNQGLGVIAAGYPVSQKVDCKTLALLGNPKPTKSENNNGLTYNASKDQYKYMWDTHDAWDGTCRRLDVRLTDGTDHTAVFKFK